MLIAPLIISLLSCFIKCFLNIPNLSSFFFRAYVPYLSQPLCRSVQFVQIAKKERCSFFVDITCVCIVSFLSLFVALTPTKWTVVPSSVSISYAFFRVLNGV